MSLDDLLSKYRAVVSVDSIPVVRYEKVLPRYM